MKWLNRLFGGPKDMAALTAGTQAPEISLPTLDGKKFVLREVLQRGPVLAAFFKCLARSASTHFLILSGFIRPMATRKSPSWGFHRTTAATPQHS